MFFSKYTNDEFSTHYITLDEVAKRHNLPMAALLKSIKKGRLTPVGGPDIDGYPSYLMHKRSIYHLKMDKLRDSAQLGMVTLTFGGSPYFEDECIFTLKELLA